MRRTWPSIVLLAGFCLPTASVLHAATPLTPAQALSYVRIADLHLSPDGRQLACVAVSHRWDARPHIRLVDVTTGVSREITPTEKSERLPQWSPDGRALAFISNRGGKTQVYALPAAGGEPAAVTASKFGVDSFHWSPDGRSIAYVARGDAAQTDGTAPQVADREGDLPRLWIIDVGTKATRELGKAGFRIDEFQWRDPGELLVVASDRPRVEEFTDGVYSVSASSGTFTLVSRPPQPFDSLLASPAGAAFLVRSTGSGGPSPRDRGAAKHLGSHGSCGRGCPLAGVVYCVDPRRRRVLPPDLAPSSQGARDAHRSVLFCRGVRRRARWDAGLRR
jgi:dipeptidyl aminopeptidase/acylaminoacyl peptidase